MKNLALFVVLLFFISCTSGNKKTNVDSRNVSTEIVEITYKVNGMHCTNCENSITKGVTELDGVEHVKANHLDSTTFVKFDAVKVSEAEIIEKIQTRGYEVTGKL